MAPSNYQTHDAGGDMHMETDQVGKRLPMQTPDAIASAGAIHDALARFYDSPTVSNKVAAVVALQAHLAAVERDRRESGAPA
jgi:hypothetical protein